MNLTDYDFNCSHKFFKHELKDGLMGSVDSMARYLVAFFEAPPAVEVAIAAVAS